MAPKKKAPTSEEIKKQIADVTATMNDKILKVRNEFKTKLKILNDDLKNAENMERQEKLETILSLSKEHLPIITQNLPEEAKKKLQNLLENT